MPVVTVIAAGAKRIEAVEGLFDPAVLLARGSVQRGDELAETRGVADRVEVAVFRDVTIVIPAGGDGVLEPGNRILLVFHQRVAAGDVVFRGRHAMAER